MRRDRVVANTATTAVYMMVFLCCLKNDLIFDIENLSGCVYLSIEIYLDLCADLISSRITGVNSLLTWLSLAKNALSNMA